MLLDFKNGTSPFLQQLQEYISSKDSNIDCWQYQWNKILKQHFY